MLVETPPPFATEAFVDAGAAVQVEVEQDRIGAQPEDRGDRVPAARRLADDTDALEAPEHLGEARADRRGIVDDEDLGLAGAEHDPSVGARLRDAHRAWTRLPRVPFPFSR